MISSIHRPVTVVLRIKYVLWRCALVYEVRCEPWTLEALPWANIRRNYMYNLRGVDPELTRGCALGPPARLQPVDKSCHQQSVEEDLTSAARGRCDQALVAWFYLTPMVSQCAGSRRAVSLTQAAAQVTEGQCGRAHRCHSCNSRTVGCVSCAECVSSRGAALQASGAKSCMPPKALSRFAERGAGSGKPPPTSARDFSLRTKRSLLLPSPVARW